MGVPVSIIGGSASVICRRNIYVLIANVYITDGGDRVNYRWTQFIELN